VDVRALKFALAALREGSYGLGIFPEGTRVRFAGQDVTYHEGVAMIAAMADAPVIPLRIWGTDRICPEGKRLFRTPKVTLRFGEPMRLSDEPFASLPRDQRNRAFTEELMRRVYAIEPLPGSPEARALAAGREA